MARSKTGADQASGEDGRRPSVFLNAANLIIGSGVVAAGAIAGGGFLARGGRRCRQSVAGAEHRPRSLAWLYPAPRNASYTVDARDHARRRSTPPTTTSMSSARTRTSPRAAEALPRRPWEVKIDGLVETGDDLRDRRPDPQDAARGAALSPPLRRGVVDGRAVDRLSARRTGQARQARSATPPTCGWRRS